MPIRRVVQAEALGWLDANAAADRDGVITSLPDVSELPELGLEAWRAWFIGAVRRVIRWVPRSGVAIFYQSDVRHGGAWIDKGYLVQRGAEEEGAHTLWHKIVCRKPPGTVALGRPSYSHMIAVSLEPRAVIRRPGPDVLPSAGFMPWSRAIGVTACRVACRFLLDESDARVVVDPFCGKGTVLAVANAMGLDAVGVDISAKRCRAARALVVGDEGGSGPSPSSPREAFLAGARLFDAGAFWEAHEAWEARWRGDIDAAERRLLQALIQIAAAFHKLLIMESPESAIRLLAKGLAKLDEQPPDAGLATFREGIVACGRAIAEGRFDRGSIPRLA
jgi:hypothetical protein